MTITKIIVEKTFWQIFVDSPYYNPINLLQGIGALATAGALLYAFKQNQSGKVQQFESTFFNLIDLHNNIIANLNYRSFTYDMFGTLDSDITHNGRQVFKAAKRKLKTELKTERVREYHNADNFTVNELTIDDIEQAKRTFKSQYFKEYYASFETELNHYFRNLYHVLKYLDQTSLVALKQKKFYAAILRAQLSQNELYIWMFNALHTNYGYPNALYLISKYDMMQNFAVNDVRPKIWLDYFNYLKKSVKKPKNWL